ncbi:MAG: zinc-binding alcohol dehydrogenase [Pseudomonadota bacterium]
MTTTKALWITGPEQAEIHETNVDPARDDVQVRTLFSGISRGTERLVFRGQVPESEYDTMRAPFQEGAFSFPVKYGYAAVGEIATGDRAGETVFALFPHQTRFSIPDAAAIPIPTNVPPARAVLTANMETALNITWDAEIGIGDRIVIVGCGLVGALVGYLAAKVPGAQVTLSDVDTDKEHLAKALGCDFVVPGDLGDDADVVVHASASAGGLDTAINTAGIEARIVEASWYGAHSVRVSLGGRFHQRRLQLISSQVGRIPAKRATRWTYQRRLAKALSLLSDPRLDALISGETAFDALAAEYGDILMDPTTLCHRVRY